MAIIPKNYLAKFGLWTNYELQILYILKTKYTNLEKKLLYFSFQQVIKTLQNHFIFIFYFAFQQKISSEQNGDYY